MPMFGSARVLSNLKPLVNNLVLRLASMQTISKKMQTSLERPKTPRENPAVKKLDTPEFHSIFREELNTLIKLFEKHNYELRIAGGAVRDLLLHINPHDIDFATTATPEQMKAMFNDEGVRMINTRGEIHGTVTPRINDKVNYEVTTLRIDKRTDGRHAEVEFTTDWLLDASRRDLTINSMFLGFDGTIYDYFFGLEDLQERRVAFVGNPNIRIKEDYLRILRYFRFYGRIAVHSNNHDSDTLEAIKNHADGLDRISGERIWSELKKIVTGNFAKDLLEVMNSCGILDKCGIPKNPNLSEFQRLCKALDNFSPPHYPILYIISLLNSPQDAINLHNRLKLSAFERDLSIFITTNRNEKCLELLESCKKMCFMQVASSTFLQETLKYCDRPEMYHKLREWEMPKFPIRGDTLVEWGCPKKKIKNVLSSLKSIFADSDYSLSADELKAHLPKLLAELTTQEEVPHKKLRQ